MARASKDPEALLRSALGTRRIHSAYLLSGPGAAPRRAALAFVRGLACTGEPPGPCEACASCRRSEPGEAIRIDGSGKAGPLYRHVGDHPDLIWVERGADDTRVRIGQVRALQRALHLRPNEGGWRGAVIADAEWLNQEAQNALLRLLEEPPPQTALVLVAASSAGLLPTLRSRCQRVAFPVGRTPPLRGPQAPEEVRELAERFDGLPEAALPDLLDWAEQYRGARAVAADRVQLFLETASAWVRERVDAGVAEGRRNLRRELDAFAVLSDCRKSLAQRNANPQMVVERALLVLRDTVAP